MKRNIKRIIAMALIATLVFNVVRAEKVEAFVPIVLGALGAEAVYLIAAALVAGGAVFLKEENAKQAANYAYNSNPTLWNDYLDEANKGYTNPQTGEVQGLTVPYSKWNSVINWIKGKFGTSSPDVSLTVDATTGSYDGKYIGFNYSIVDLSSISWVNDTKHVIFYWNGTYYIIYNPPKFYYLTMWGCGMIRFSDSFSPSLTSVDGKNWTLDPRGYSMVQIDEGTAPRNGFKLLYCPNIYDESGVLRVPAMTYQGACDDIKYKYDLASATQTDVIIGSTKVSDNDKVKIPFSKPDLGDVLNKKSTDLPIKVNDTVVQQGTGSLTMATPITAVSINNINPSVGDILVSNVLPLNAVVTYQWFSDGQKVSDEPFYKPVATDVGKSIFVTTTGIGNSSGVITSNPTNKVRPAYIPLTGISLNIDSPKVGDVLKVTTVPADATADYVWSVDGTDISTDPTYKVDEKDFRKSVGVTVTGTGYNVGNPVKAKTKEVVMPTDIDVGGDLIVPTPDGSLNFNKFRTGGAALAKVFPFCIPFDFANAIKSMVATPKAPKWHVDFSKTKMAAAGNLLDLDLSKFDYLAKIVRFFVYIGFVVGLILLTRQIIRG